MESKEEINKIKSIIDYEKLQKLQCPFTWGLNEISRSHEDTQEHGPTDEENNIVVLILLRCIVQAFEASINNDFKGALEYAEESEDILKNAKTEDIEDFKVSKSALKHIILATKCWIYEASKNIEKVEEILKEINDLKCSHEDMSTFNGCKSVVWCKYHISVGEKAIEYANKALEAEPNCGLWHFIVGKIMRRLRRDISMRKRIDNREIYCFKKAYKLSSNSLFHLYYAQSLKDSKKWDNAKAEFIKIFESKPELLGIRMRLALNLMSYDMLDLAKECLDYVANRCEDYSMYLHYRGILLEKQKNFQEATKYYKLAADKNNFPADVGYALCFEKIDVNFNIVEHFLGILEKYKNLSNTKKQQMLLNIACYYTERKNDFDNAMKYFLEALSIDPESDAINNYINIFNRPRSNIYLNLSKILSEIEILRDSTKEETLDMCKKLKEMCDTHYNKRRAAATKRFSKITL